MVGTSKTCTAHELPLAQETLPLFEGADIACCSPFRSPIFLLEFPPSSICRFHPFFHLSPTSRFPASTKIPIPFSLTVSHDPTPHVGCAGGGEVGGRVTRTEWHEHHADMSALISDDEAFWSYLWNVWGLSGGRGSDNGERDNGKQIPTRNSSANRVIGKSRPPLSAASNLRRSDEDDGMGDHTLSSGISDTEARKSVAEKADRHPRDLSLHSIPYKAWAALPSSNAETVDFVGRATSRGVPGNSIPAGVAGLLERARGSLAVGGVRDAFRLLKGFREEDHGGDGKVSLTGFKAAIGGARFGLNETEIRIIFQVRKEESSKDWKGED